MNILLNTPTHKIRSEGVLFTDNRTEYNIENLTITVNGAQASNSVTGDYIADIDDTVQVSATLLGQEDLSYPNVVLKLPVLRYGNGSPTDDEIYWNATIVNNQFTVTGKFPRSGDWKFTQERINLALQRAGLGWKINIKDTSFLV